MNISAMTVFLDIGDWVFADKSHSQANTSTAACRVEERKGDRQNVPLVEEYQNLLISFDYVPGSQAGLGRFISYRAEPQLELIRLLKRLKYRYCLQVAIIGFSILGFRHPRLWKPELKSIVDVYIAMNRAEIYESPGLYTIVHDDYSSTLEKLKVFGLFDK